MPFLHDTDKVEGKWSEDGEHFTLTKPMFYKSHSVSRLVVRIPANFKTDFASSWVGRFCLLSRKAAFSAAAVLHDWLYFEGVEDKATADLLFREALQSQGVGAYDVWKAYWGVRLFGGPAWRAHRAREKGKQ